MPAVTIRPLRAEDGEIAGAIFFNAVHGGTAEHYTLEQREAWAGVAPNPSGWRDRLLHVDGFPAELGGIPVGFMTINAVGYIDLAFVSPAVVGKGVGWRLYQAVEERAGQLGVVCLTTEARKKSQTLF